MDVKYIRSDIIHESGNRAESVTLKVHKNGYLSCGGLYFDRFSGRSEGHAAGHSAYLLLHTVETWDLRPADFAPFLYRAAVRSDRDGKYRWTEFRETKSMYIAKDGRKFRKSTGEAIGFQRRPGKISLSTVEQVNMSYGIPDYGIKDSTDKQGKE